ncbi:DUF4347 domain-containing protein, partial [Microcoleus sp. Aus8_D4]
MPNFNCQVSGSAIAFIDTQVPNYQSLVAGVTPGTEVVVLDENRDAIDQITEILALRTNIDSIHIVSHGTPGRLQLGSGSLSLDNLDAYSEKLQQWPSAFTHGADILIYGCNVASEPGASLNVREGINSLFERESRLKPKFCAIFNHPVGAGSPTALKITDRLNKPALPHEKAPININEWAIDNQHPADNFTFIQRIAQLTNTNVAASKNLTGSAAKGGDWELEVTTGKIAAPLAFRPEVLAAYNHVLATFSEARNYSSGQGRISDIGTGDFNGDGFLDLVVPMGENNSPKDLAILLGTGTTGSFGTPISLFKPGKENPSGVAVADFNGDGKLDLATTNLGFSNGNFVSIRLGTGTGSFGDPTNFGQGIDHKSIVTGDFNGDGKLDLATTPYSIFDNFISILFGDGTGSFGTPVKISTQTPKFTLATADFNGDGKLDLVTSNNEKTNNISVFLGDGKGNFNSPVNLSSPTNNGSTGGTERTVITGDFNGDSKLDIATNNSTDRSVSVFLGDGTGNFDTANNFNVATTGGFPQFVVAGDFNGDGKLDLATSNYFSTYLSVLLGDGTGKFGTLSNFTIPNSFAYAYMIARDFNADGKLDIATAFDQNVSVLLNTSNTVNFGAATYSSVEGTTDTVVNIPVKITGGTPLNDVVVPIVLDPISTATENSDYTFSPTSITFPAGATGDELTKNVAVTIKSDNLSENPETVIFNLGTITGAIAGSTKKTTLTISDRGSVAYAIATDTATIDEGNSGKKPLTFTVTRSNVTNGASSVKYAIAGTATNVTDYNNIGGTSGARTTAGTINFVTGEISKTITLDVLGDTVVEPDETITVTLSNATGIAAAIPIITADTATTTIINYTAPTPTPTPISPTPTPTPISPTPTPTPISPTP